MACIPSTSPHTRHEQIATVIHELSHVLAFSPSLLPFYRHPQTGEPLTPRDSKTGLPATPKSGEVYQASDATTIKNFTERGRTVTKLILPTMLQKARDHFGCQSLNGVELENQGGELTRLAHLEKRVYGTESMTGVMIHGAMAEFSDITLASFEDSGWYQVDYSYALPLSWGKGHGCSFAQEPCLTPSSAGSEKEVETAFPAVWCTDRDKVECGVGAYGPALCFMYEHDAQDVQPYDRYFPVTNHSRTGLVNASYSDGYVLGGGVALADYCPFRLQFNPNYAETDETFTDCRFLSSRTPSLFPGNERFSPASRCFSSSLELEIMKGDSAFDGLRCYNTRCDRQTNGHLQLFVTVGSFEVDCGSTEDAPSLDPKARQRSVKGYRGTITCPNVSDICFNDCPNQCSGLGRCVDQNCVCAPGWEGPDCSFEVGTYSLAVVMSVPFVLVSSLTLITCTLFHL
jgi:leishmanolysin-like peptidase